MESSFGNDPLVVRMARNDRLALLLREDAQLERMAKQWLAIERSLDKEMIELAQQIAEAKANGSIITEQLIRRMDKYKILNAQLKAQILEYAKTQAAKDIAEEQLAYALQGVTTATALIKAQMSLGVVFKTLSVDQLTDLSGLLADGSPLYNLLREAYPDALDGIIKALLEGSAKGWGPGQNAAYMAKKMGLGLERLTLIARTEQLRAWRIATARQYKESGVVLYSKRVCAKSSRTCMACLAADGEIVPIDEVLSDHPRGRCTTVPVVKGAKDIVWESGISWFEQQPADIQRQMMGPGMYNLWQQKQFDLRELKGVTVNKVWGNSPRVKTLQEMAVLYGEVE
jgi:hypothetical protein